ncbi:MAG: hypothetical protein K0S12_1913, partial [Bacteroidetes bacterium]|nr:hypothetical protein [Bacteroidota bacterium]
RPDTIVPAKPLITGVTPVITGLTLEFIRSHSEDVARHDLLRRHEQDSVFTTIESFLSDSSQTFFDSTVVSGSSFVYQLVAVDSAGNKSASKTFALKFESGFRQKINELKYSVDRETKSILLTWDYPEKDIEKFILYRNKPGEKLSMLKTISGDIFNFKDRSAFIGNVYEYRVKAVLSSGAESIISDAVKVTY